MAINILADSTKIQIAAGYESGHTMVFVQADPAAPFDRLYCAQPHTQPGSAPFIFPTMYVHADDYSTLHLDITVQRPLHQLLCRCQHRQAPFSVFKGRFQDRVQTDQNRFNEACGTARHMLPLGWPDFLHSWMGFCHSRLLWQDLEGSCCAEMAQRRLLCHRICDYFFRI